VGSTTVTYTNPDYSWAQQDIKYHIAVQQPIQININLIINALSYPSDIRTKIKDAILQNWNEGFTAADGTPIAPVSMRTGTIYATRFGGSINNVGVSEYTLEIGETGGSMGSLVIVTADKAPTLVADDIFVLINGNP
jgi:hypothetical protein